MRQLPPVKKVVQLRHISMIDVSLERVVRRVMQLRNAGVDCGLGHCAGYGSEQASIERFGEDVIAPKLELIDVERLQHFHRRRLFG